jgi:CBS domain-containing protein
MKVRELMSDHELLTTTEQDTLAAAAHRMSWKGCRHLPVVRGRDVVGVISERDVLAWVAEGRRLDAPDSRVGTAMTSPAVVATPDEEIGEVAARMISRRVGCMPVVVGWSLVGMVTRGDLLGRIVAEMYTPALDLG